MAKAEKGAKEKEAPKEKIKLSVSGILADLSNGLDRKAIRLKYGLSATDVVRLFQDPKLKGARVRTAPAFELTDDTEEKAVEVKDKPKAEAKPAATTTKAKVKAEEKVEEEDTNEEAEVKEDKEEVASSGIKEVVSEQDSVEEKDETKETKDKTTKGLW